MTECKTRAERNRDRKTKEEKQFLPVSCFANMQSMGEGYKLVSHMILML